MNDNPYIDPFLNDVDSMSHAGVGDVTLITCLSIAGLAFATLMVVIALTRRDVQSGSITRSVERRRLKVIGVLGVLAGLTASFPLALAGSEQGIWSSIVWELCGAIVMTLLILGFAASALAHGSQPTDPREIEDDDCHQRSRGVNPATGYPMVNGAIDAGGYSYGCGPDHSSDDRHWERE